MAVLHRCQLSEFRNGSHEATLQFVWGPRYIDEAISMNVDADGDGICTDYTDTGQNPAGGAERWYYMQDANWNVVRLWSDTVTSGLKSERYEYDPYGTTRVVAGYDTALAAERLHVMPDSLAGNPFRCAGYYFDDERGAYLVRYRMYLPWLGRWGQTDPRGYADTLGRTSEPLGSIALTWADPTDQYADGMNLYQYCTGQPVGLVDPDGMHAICPSGMQDIIDDIIEDIYNQAEKRRGKGPWGDSAQHCWAACYIVSRYGLGPGMAACLLESLAELLGSEGDYLRDVAANNFGLGCPLANPPLFWMFPARMCDCCCLTL